MIVKKGSKKGLVSTVFGIFFAIIGMFAGLAAPVMNANTVYADEPGETSATTVDENEEEQGEEQQSEEQPSQLEKESQPGISTGDKCQESLGAIGWLVCPTTGKIAEAVDWLYEKIEGILIISPVSAEDGSPIYEIWKYCLSVTNIVFVIFLLVVIYSQITGYGITNYGIKKALPKLIVTAVLVNLSFLICSLAVDVSNILGNGIRGIFATVQETVTSNGFTAGTQVSYADMYESLAGGTLLTVGAGVVAFETGAIWMLIPTVLGAVAAVVVGLITIALRQAVVALLIMIAPLAIVAYILPNTEQWFKKWKQLLTKMLVFYPMFSLLFGASSLAGFAIIASAKDGFGILLGVAVQIFPLFFSWKLMQMSGTFLSTINGKMQGLAAKPLATNRAWAESHRALSRARHLERNRMPSAKLMNFLAYRKTSRGDETESIDDGLKARYRAKSDAGDYDSTGKLSKRGQRRYARQARTMRYEKFSQMHKDNLGEGFSEHSSEYRETIAEERKNLLKSQGVYSLAVKGGKYEERIKALDKANMDASDDLKAEIARGAEIEYKNAKGFFERALNAKFADDDSRALLADNKRHQMHPGVLDNPENLARYRRWKTIMEGQDDGVQTVIADAASSAHAQAQIRRNKFQAKADLTPATQNVEDHVRELIESPNANKNIDAIIGGLRVLNMRGDTDIVARQAARRLIGVFDQGKIELGTYASQAIANFTMFDVKDNDPTLRRFGKYINMQTAALYNDNDPEKRRVRKDVTWWEYVNSEYVEHDENGNVAYDSDGNVIKKKTRGMRELMQGTSYANVERTSYKSQREGVRAASYDVGPDGNLSAEFNLDRYFNNMDGLYDSTLANIIGDQFSYRSGSEQIMALAKDLTGIGKDGKWDWKYIFGDEIKDPTLEQKAKYIVRARDLVKKFLGGHVASQIARSKTDTLQAVRSLYALLDEVMLKDEKGNDLGVDLERLAALEEREFNDEDDSYNNFLEEKKEAIKKRTQAAFNENALKGFAKQTKRGYQGESKDLLFKMLDPEELYDKYFSSEKTYRQTRSRNEINDEDDGMLVEGDFGGDVLDGGVYNDTRERIREIYEDYSRSGRSDVTGFWSDAGSVLGSSAEMGDLKVALDQFAEGVPQYTDISQLYHEIMRTFFDSD